MLYRAFTKTLGFLKPCKAALSTLVRFAREKIITESVDLLIFALRMIVKYFQRLGLQCREHCRQHRNLIAAVIVH